MFFDDFSDGQLDGWTVVGNAKIDSGNLLAGPGKKDGFHAAYPTGLVVDDFVLEYKMNILSNVGTTVTYFRLSGPTPQKVNTGYFLSFRDDQRSVGLWKRESGSEPLLKTAQFRHALNTWYDIRVEARGNSIRVFVDDALIIDVKDTSFSSGALQLGAWQHSRYGWTNEQVAYDDVKVTPLNPRTEETGG